MKIFRTISQFYFATASLLICGCFTSPIYVTNRNRITELPVERSGLPAGQVHDFTFTTEDDLELHGWHFLANDIACQNKTECDAELTKGRPLILFFHGNAGDRAGRVEICKLLSNLGADVFIIDYRGYGENPGKPSEKGLAKDARALWKYAVEERNVSSERIVIFGASLGGGVATSLAAELCKNNQPPAGLILRSTFSSVTDAASHHFPWVPVKLVLADRYYSDEHIKSVTSPILQVHGTVDKVIPITLGQKLFDAAPEQSANNVPKRFVELSNVGHNNVLSFAREKLIEEYGQFLQHIVWQLQENQSSQFSSTTQGFE